MSETLTGEQNEVVYSNNRYSLVNACPGSGKTTTLAAKCEMLPEKESKLVLAFNKYAVTQFKKKLSDQNTANVRTFHSFCFAQVMKNWELYGYSTEPRLDADSSLLDLLKMSHGFKVSDKVGWDKLNVDKRYATMLETSFYDQDVEKLLKEYSQQDNHRVNKIIPKLFQEMREAEAKKDYRLVNSLKSQIEEIKAKSREKSTLEKVKKLREWMKDNNIVTFDSMVREVAWNRKHLHHKFKHIFVDEFQDIDRFQYAIIKRLGANSSVKTMTCVGDPKQRIYGWRGALTNPFTKFQGDFDNVKNFKLSINFRSTSEIVSYAEEIIPDGMKSNTGSVEGSLKQGSLCGTGEEARLFSFKKLFEGGVLPKDLSNTAIICRHNKTCAQWQLLLARRNIPVYVFGGGQFWKQSHVMLAMEGRDKGWSFGDLEDSDKWIKLMATFAYRSPENKEEASQEASWVLGLSEQDIQLLRTNYQNQKGVKISTVHKTKGLEFEKVLVSDIDESFENDKCTYYVACTRAERMLYLHHLEQKTKKENQDDSTKEA